MLIAVSDLSAYLYCPRALYLRRIKKLLAPPNKAMVMGSLMHAAKQAAIGVDEKAVVSAPEGAKLEDFKMLFSRNYKTAIVDLVNSRKEQLSAFSVSPAEAFMFLWPEISRPIDKKVVSASKTAMEKNVWGHKLWSRIIPKQFAEQPVSSQRLGLKGIIDRVDSYPDSEWVFEEKTGRVPNKGVWPAHRIQVAAYQMILRDSARKAVQGFVLYGEHQREVVLNPFIEEEVIDTRNKTEETLNGEIPAECFRPGKCDICEIQKAKQDFQPRSFQRNL